MVAQYENVELIKKDIDDVIDYYITYKGSKKTSMLEDIMNNRKTENEYLAGDLIRLAEKHDVSTQMIKTLYYLIKIREEQYLERQYESDRACKIKCVSKKIACTLFQFWESVLQ